MENHTANVSTNVTLTANINAVSTTPTDMDALKRFAESFQRPHGVLSLIIAVVGIAFQIINIMVLTNPKMRNPVNCLLTTLAVFEMAMLSIYVPFVTMFNVRPPDGWYQYNTPSITAARYLLFYADTSVFLHLVISWLLIATSCFRFLFVQYPLKSTRWCSYRRAFITTVCTILGALIITSPNMIANMIVSLNNCETNGTSCKELYTVAPARFSHDEVLSMANIWIYAILGKFLPSILLLIFTFLLLKILREASERSARLHQESSRHKNEHRQTTRMLLAVVIFFTIIELPHGILLLYTLLSGKYDTYNHLGDVIDLVTLTAFSINFILYSIMSRQYRRLFVNIICGGFHKIPLGNLSVKFKRVSTNEKFSEIQPSRNPSMATELCVVSMSPDSQTMLSVDE